MSARAQLGWTVGEFSDTFAVTGFAPTGKYEPEFYPDIGLNRPAVDTTWAFIERQGSTDCVEKVEKCTTLRNALLHAEHLSRL
jgi:hypothetical protein